MAILRFQCGKCGKWLKALDSDAGRRGKCIRCGAPIRVPIAEARPVSEPEVMPVPAVRTQARGVLWELKEHPLWLVAGIVAVLLFVGAIVGLKLMSRAGRQAVALVPQTRSEEDDTQTAGPNEPAPVAQTPDTSRQEAQASRTAPAASTGSDTSAVATTTPPSRPAVEVRSPVSSDGEGDMLPLWARIVLDEALFPPDVTWRRAEGFFRSYSESKPELLEKLESLQPAALFRPPYLGSLPPEAISKKYGQAVVTQETNMTWHNYGLLGFGVKAGEKDCSEVRAPVRVFRRGFVESARESGVPKPSAFFIPDAGAVLKATEQVPVTIVNMRTVAIQVLIGGAGPCTVDPGRKKVVRLPPAYYPVEVSSGGAPAVTATVPAFPRARWEIANDMEGSGSACVRLAAEPNPSGGPTDAEPAHVKIVNGHNASVKVQIGYEGRYYRLKPQGQVEISVKTNTYIVGIEEGTRSAYQVVEASGSVVWSIAADPGLLPFKVTASEGLPVAGSGIPVASPVVTPVCPIDPNDLADGPRLLAGHSEAVTCVAFSPDGSGILSGAKDNVLHLWDVAGQDANSQLLRTIQGGHIPATALAFAPDGQSVWSSDASGKEIVCHDVNTGDELGGLALRTCNASVVAFSHQTQKVLLGGQALFLWDLETGELLQQWKLPGKAGASGTITACDLSRDDRRALCGDPNGQLTMIDVTTGGITWSLKAHNGRVTAVAFDSEGRQAASASEDGTVCLWDLQTQKESARLQGHVARITAVAFAPNGKKVLSASSDKTIRVWDVETGKEIGCLEEHTGPVLCASFSPDPDGALVVSGSEDRTVQVWKTPELAPVAVKEAPQLKRMPNAVIIATTQVAPDISALASTWWANPKTGELRVRRPGRKEFVWVQIRQATGDKLGFQGFRLTDANDTEIGRLAIDPIDSRDYVGVAMPLSAVKLDVVRGVDVESDQSTVILLHRLATRAMFKLRDRTILLIFDADHDSSTQCYLRNDDVREPLQFKPYESAASGSSRTAKPRVPQPLPDKNRKRKPK